MPRDLDGATPPPDVLRDFHLGPSVTLPFSFFARLPPGSACAVAAWLDFKCAEFAASRGRPICGVYHGTHAIGDQLGLGESTVRGALADLERARLVELTEFLGADGRPRTMIWCKWRLPHWLEGATLETGLGTRIRLGAEGEAPEIIPASPPPPGRRTPPLPFPVPVHARMAPISAPISAPKVNPGDKKPRKTTDRVDAGAVVVVASPSREGSGETGPSPVTPAPPIAPPIAAKLDLVEDQVERAALVAEIPIWLTLWKIERIAEAIEIGAAKRAKSLVKTTLVAYVGGILGTWQIEGYRPSRHARRMAPSPVNLPTADVVAANSERKAVARRADPRQLWEELDPARRQAIEAEFDRENARPAETPESLWPLARKLGCIELMAKKSGSGAG